MFWPPLWHLIFRLSLHGTRLCLVTSLFLHAPPAGMRREPQPSCFNPVAGFDIKNEVVISAPLPYPPRAAFGRRRLCEARGSCSLGSSTFCHADIVMVFPFFVS